MRATLLRAMALFVGLHLARGGFALACSCLEDEQTPEERLLTWDMVFVGEVVDPEQAASGCGGGKTDDVVTVFAVKEGFQGVTRGDEVEVHHNRDGAACGGTFVAGEDWLLYTDGAWSLCSPGGPATAHASEIEALRDATN